MSLGIVIGIGILVGLTIRSIGIRVGECLIAILIGVIRIGIIHGMVIITAIMILVSMKVITDIMATVAVLLTVIMQWNTIEYMETQIVHAMRTDIDLLQREFITTEFILTTL